MTDTTFYAEDMNYWQTGKSNVDVWQEKTRREIEKVGGRVTTEVIGTVEGKSALMLGFSWGIDSFKITWPVLPSRSGNDKAARIQAATCVFYDVKAKCMIVKVFGVRGAFMPYYVLPNGHTVIEASVPELAETLPGLFLLPR